MNVWNVLHAARWNTGRKNYAKNRHLRIIAQSCVSSQRRHVLTIVKTLLNSNIFSTCLHNMVNFDPLTAEIGWQVWGTTANFKGFRVLASLLYRPSLNRGQPNLARCLAVCWANTLYIHFCGLLLQRNYARCKIHFASKSCVLLYWQRYCTALEQWALAKLCGVVSLQGRAAIPFDIKRSNCIVFY